MKRTLADCPPGVVWHICLDAAAGAYNPAAQLLHNWRMLTAECGSLGDRALAGAVRYLSGDPSYGAELDTPYWRDGHGYDAWKEQQTPTSPERTISRAEAKAEGWIS